MTSLQRWARSSWEMGVNVWLVASLRAVTRRWRASYKTVKWCALKRSERPKWTHVWGLMNLTDVKDYLADVRKRVFIAVAKF